MNIVVFNGSPRISKSNTMKITDAFLQGINEQLGANTVVDIFDIYKKDVVINDCIGCFTCWTKSPGKCVFKDSMVEIMEKFLAADIVIWSFPLYFFGMPSKIKACLDRQLPTLLPFMLSDQAGHQMRYDLSHQKNVIIVSGGLSAIENNFEAVEKQFDIMYSMSKAQFTKIFCPQNPLLGTDALGASNKAYLNLVTTAGKEFARDNKISDETQAKIDTPFFPIDIYNKMADSSWEINDGDDSAAPKKALAFTKQMAAIYKPASYTKDFVLEMDYIDVNEKYQVLVTRQGATVIEENYKPYTTKIETPFTVWKSISSGEISGEQALMEGKYRVLGDFSYMLHWDSFFGYEYQSKQEEEVPATAAKGNAKKTNMSMMLIPWITFWVASSIHSLWGGIATIFVTSCVTLLSSKIKFTTYDRVSGVLVSGLSIASILNFDIAILLPVSYLLFAALWLISIFTKAPLTTHYSCYGYGGEKAFSNPLFMKTNSILTICWGVLYILITIFAFFAMKTPIAPFVSAINIIPPIVFGVFTAWFQKWYPAKVARQEIIR